MQKKKKYTKTIFLAKAKLNSKKALIPTALTGSYISHDEFALVNNFLNEFDDINEIFKHLKASPINQRI